MPRVSSSASIRFSMRSFSALASHARGTCVERLRLGRQEIYSLPCESSFKFADFSFGFSRPSSAFKGGSILLASL